MLLDIAWVILGLAGLIVGGEWLVKGAVRLAGLTGLPTLLIGTTIVALGTSAPELVVSISSGIQGKSDIALGNVVGSNIANLGLILGVSGLIKGLVIDFRLIRREMPFLVLITVLVYLAAANQNISRLEGILFLLLYGGFSVILYVLAQRGTSPNDAAGRAEIEEEIEEIEGELGRIHPGQEGLRFLAGLALLIVGANRTIEGATALAREAGVSDLIIGLTLVALGTSLPELITTVTAVLRGHDDLAAGNVIGSNITNLLVILGFTAIVEPVSVPQSALGLEFPIMLGLTIGLLPFILNGHLARWQSGVLLAVYVGFIAVQFI
jgi:cation:H+ antiporter